MTNRSPTSTELERAALEGAINLADGHARQPLVPSQQAIIDRLPDIFERAERYGQAALEQRFAQSFFLLANESDALRFRTPLLSYSASTSTQLAAEHLRKIASRLALVEPCFDNIQRLIRNQFPDAIPIEESALIDGVLLDELLQTVEILWIAQPNNPTGFLLTKRQFEEIAETCRRRDIVLVIDGCFRFFSRPLYEWSQYEVLEKLGTSFVFLEDTGKTWKTLEMKVGITVCSQDHYGALFRLHDDLLLGTSPFHLLLLSELIEDTVSIGVNRAIIDIVAHNRVLVEELYLNPSLARGSTHSSNSPLEWVAYSGTSSLAATIEDLRNSGVHLLLGDNFFWAMTSRHGKYFRVPLNRATAGIKTALPVIQRAFA